MHEPVLHVQACVIGALSSDEDIEQGATAALCAADLLAPWVTTGPVRTLATCRCLRRSPCPLHALGLASASSADAARRLTILHEGRNVQLMQS